ncbi:MAG: alpha/beta hydrolase [Methanosarcinaceae archaeon]|nr:alpha/beta hydrolase [Methanosarcinaceae archaeon]
MNLTKTAFFFVLLLILAGVYGILQTPDPSEWIISDGGLISYPQRGDVVYSITDMEDTGTSDTLKLVSFESQNTVINGLLRIPGSDTKVPAVVLLPGAGVTKENEQGLASIISIMGYASIALDQRNLGGIDPQGDLEMFKKGMDPVEYSMVYDVLKAADVLRKQSEIDSDNIAIIGSSNGGRFAIIATALDPAIKGVIGISTSGYDTDSIDPARVGDMEAYTFYISIDPDMYIRQISPRRVVMLHSLNDTIIPYEMAQKTFDKAGEPKAMYNITDPTHGYTGSMQPYLEQELQTIFTF